MGKILIIAEKPSVGRDIARVLGCKKNADGCLVGEDYIVSWAIGHLVTLAEPEDYHKEWKRWDANTLPMLPQSMKLKSISQTMKQLRRLRELMNDTETDSIICATDSGREGELIFRYIYRITKCEKPFSRLWISSMTDIAIKEGFAKLKKGEEYDDLYFSAKCRSEADWLVGMNATRAYSLRYGTLLSIGRVQTPTLAMIVTRQKEIDAFDSKDYFEVQSNYKDFTGIWIDRENNQTKIQEKEKADEIAKKVKGKEGILDEIQKEKKNQPAPLLYDLTELQRDCNKRFGFSAQKTLNLAQDLYEKRKMITYPRTDSRYLSHDMVDTVKETLKKVKAIGCYTPFVERILEKEKLPFSKRIIDDSKVTDHHAIIPANGKVRIESLSVDEKKVYHLIVLRFLAVFYPPYQYTITKLFVKGEGETFLSKGTTVVDWGYMEIYNVLQKTEEKKKKEEDQQLPQLNQGDPVHFEDAVVLKKKTKAPSPYTESSLLSAMENAGRFVEDETLKEQLKESGIGTPATRAAIIERILAVGYVIRKGKNLIPTEKGMKIIEVVPEQLKSPETTGKWEKGLSSIAKGSMEDKRFMDSIKRYVTFLVGDAKTKHQDVIFPSDEPKWKGNVQKGFGTCPLCKSGMVLENTKSFYCSNWKQGCKLSLWKDSVKPYGITLDATMVKTLLEDGVVQEVFATLPQTGEQKKGSMRLNLENGCRVELVNLQNKETTISKENEVTEESE